MKDNSNCIILFVKAPVKGFVKTRLAKDIGENKACALYKKMAEHIIVEIKKTGYELEIFYHPPEKLDDLKSWLGDDAQLFPQAGDDLGLKMSNAISSALKRGYRNVILVGSDIPGINSEIFRYGFGKVSEVPVIGPCEDGGYYMIGFNSFTFNSDYFKDISWSTGKVMKETLEKMFEKKIIPVFLPLLNDIDTLEDLEKSNFIEMI